MPVAVTPVPALTPAPAAESAPECVLQPVVSDAVLPGASAAAVTPESLTPVRLESDTPVKRDKSAGDQARGSKNLPPKHLAPFLYKPGQSGNPAGLPKGKSKAQLLQEAIENAVSEEDYQAIAKAMADKAKHGSIKAANLIWDRTCGKPHQSITVQAQQSTVLELSEDTTPPSLPPALPDKTTPEGSE